MWFCFHKRSAVRCLKQDSLFEVKYERQFYVSLLHPGFCSVLLIDSSDRDRIVGVATARAEDDDGLWGDALLERCRQRKTGYIMTLGVHPLYRRRGLARILLQVLCCLLAVLPEELCQRAKKREMHAFAFQNTCSSFCRESSTCCAMKAVRMYGCIV